MGTSTNSGLGRNGAQLELQRGQALSVFGGSGSGIKRLFASLIDSALGRADGIGAYDIKFGFESDRPGCLGVLFDDASWSFCNLRVDEEIAFVLENAGVDPIAMPDLVDATLAQVGLSGFGARRISTLSGGELRKVALGAILVGRPDLIISDDLNGHLDLAALDQLELVLQTYAEENGACWLDFRRRWEGFLPPAEPYATLERGELSFHPRGTMHSGEHAVGQPFGMALSSHLSAELRCEVPLFHSTSEAVQWLASEDVGLSAAAHPERASTSVLRANDIWFGYHETLPLFRGCGIELKAGVICALGGRNGTGKSTLARILCGLLRPHAAQISLGNQAASRSALRRAGSLVFQKPEYQFVTDSVEEELALAQSDSGNGMKDLDATAMLATFQLEHLHKNHPFSLSIGEKRRLSVACAIASGRDFLIVDEPTLGQDEEQTRLLGSQLRSAAGAGRSVLLITHDPEFIVGYCDEVMWLEDGKLVELGSPPEAFAINSGTMFAGRSHLLELWELACAAHVADGDPPRRLEEVTVSRG